MLLKHRTHGTIAILTLATFLLLPGCSVMIGRSGISGLGEIPDGLSRKEVQERFGSPASSGTTNVGRPVEVYHIRQKIYRDIDMAAKKGWCILLLPACPFILAASEPLNVPVALVRSEINKLEVAFVYGADDHVLYFYEPKAEPSSKYHQALGTLTHPLSSETELAKCPSAKECTDRYVEERQRRAAEIGYTNPISQQFYDAIYSLEVSLLKEIAEGKCPAVADCVAGYTEEFRRQAAASNFPLTPQGEEFFRLELELAKDVDDGKITKEEMIRGWWPHHVHLYLDIH